MPYLLFGDVELAADDLGHPQSALRFGEHGGEAVQSLEQYRDMSAKQKVTLSCTNPLFHKNISDRVVLVIGLEVAHLQEDLLCSGR